MPTTDLAGLSKAFRSLSRMPVSTCPKNANDVAWAVRVNADRTTAETRIPTVVVFFALF